MPSRFSQKPSAVVIVHGELRSELNFQNLYLSVNDFACIHFVKVGTCRFVRIEPKGGVGARSREWRGILMKRQFKRAAEKGMQNKHREIAKRKQTYRYGKNISVWKWREREREREREQEMERASEKWRETSRSETSRGTEIETVKEKHTGT